MRVDVDYELCYVWIYRNMCFTCIDIDIWNVGGIYMYLNMIYYMQVRDMDSFMHLIRIRDGLESLDDVIDMRNVIGS